MEKLVDIIRGEISEGGHFGSIAVTGEGGRLIAYAGDPFTVTYFRSAAKPVQALPVVESGAAAHYGLESRELAVICGSHMGEKIHEDAVLSILGKAGYCEEDLKCGIVPPIDGKNRRKYIGEGKGFRTLHSPCSGKHSGMLTLNAFLGADKETYYKKEHPVQKKMLRTVAEMCNYPEEKIILGTDGCGVPVFGMPVFNMAEAYRNLVVRENMSEERRQACADICAAMTSYPEMVSGTGRFTSRLMEKMQGRVVAKDGAEAVYALGIPDKKMGVFIKISDGGARALSPVVISVLEQLGILDENEKELFAADRDVPLKNHRKEIIGSLSPAFRLSFV